MKQLLYIALLLLGSQLFFQNCAKRGRPTGGEKDSIPPVVINLQPIDKSTNFNSDKIKIKFDEYVLFKDLANQLIVSPPLKTLPVITPSGASKEFTITLNDTLAQNTTYTFDFGNSIVDNNEGNKLERFKYIFSTGTYIDSLTLKGTVSDAFERKTEKNIAVMLYEVNDSFNDSIVFRKKPNYITNTLDSTAFELSNLKAGKYLMIALKEKSHNYIFDPKTDKIGFVSHLIHLPTDSTFHISLFKDFVAFKSRKPVEFKKGQLIFGFEGNPSEMNVKLLSNVPTTFKSHITFDKKKDTLYYWHSPVTTDSLSFEVSNKNYSKKYTVKIGDAKKDSLVLQAVGSGMLHLRDQFKITSNIPLDQIDKSKIKLYEKDTTSVSLTTDLSKEKDAVIFTFDKKEFTGYKVKVYPKAITDLLGNSNKDTLNYQFITGQTDNYGNLTINLNNKKPNIIVELLTENGQIVEQVFIENQQSVTFNNLPPAKYILRFIEDNNQNKRWDTGDYLNKIQPEKIIYYPNPIDVRANWDIIETFSLH